MEPENATASICRHIKTNGRRCQAYAIGSSAFCYFHRTLHRSHRSASVVAAPPLRPETVQYYLEHGESLPQSAPQPALNFPPLEDADAVQIAISLLFAALVAGQINPDHARTLLYALQIASFNVRSTSPAIPSEKERATLVRRIVRNRHGQLLAAPGEDNGTPSQSERPISALEQFLELNTYPREGPDAPSTHSESNI